MPLNLSHHFALASAAVSAILFSFPVQAQIAGDGTLGTQVNGNLTAPCTGICAITNGTTRGSNLFHSFRQFSLPNGDVAAFITDPAIQNVIVRVTGVGQPFISNINGTIATFDPAFNLAPRNFFLLNPNGIVFGPNAGFFVGGSFLASTAERMLFQNGTVFDTRDQTVAPLLTVSVPIGLQFGQTPGEIQSRMRIGAGFNSSFTDIALVGGNVTLDKSTILVPGRGVELAGVGENGTVGLQLNGNRLSLSFASDTPRWDISLTNGSIVSAGTTEGNGEVVMTGRNITLSSSSVFTGILAGIDNAATNQAGDIAIDATGSLQLTQGSNIANLVDGNAIGQGGNVRISATNIRVFDTSTIQASTFGNGNAGNVRVTSNTIAMDNGEIGSQVFSTGKGQGGDVTVQAGSITLINGASISANTLGNGNAGNVQVTANTIALDGTTPAGASGIGNLVGSTGRGSGGNITIETDSLNVTNGAGISASTLGNGNAGNVRVVARTIALDGTASNGLSTGGISNQVIGPTSIGRGGDITIETGSLAMTNGARIAAGTLGNGDAGNVQINANTITLDGTTPSGQGTSITSQVEPRGIGRGGNITIQTDSLALANSAVVSAGTFGEGDGGNVRVTANTITLDGAALNGQGASGIGSQVGLTGIGSGGDVIVETGSLSVTNGAGISAGVFGRGNAGNLWVTAKTIVLDGTTSNGQFVSGIGSQVAPTGIGRGGNVNIQANSLTVMNGAVVSSSALGNGSAGNLDITAQNIQLDRGGITALAVSGDGANINLNVGKLLLMRRGSQISTTAGNDQFGGNGGNITINSPRGFIVGVKGENSDITANAFTGSGGRVNITTQGIYGLQFRPRLTEFSDITASSTFGVSGVVAINTLGIDPSRGLQPLPVSLVDPSNRIDQKCRVGSGFRRSSFTVTGRGGLPENPLDPLQSGEGVASWVEVGTDNPQISSLTQNPKSKIQSPKFPALLIEADSLIVDKDGNIQLVASRAIAESISSWYLPTCASVEDRDR
ncbi:MAG: hypothetical protein DCF22_08895 [Leptolyngbya sp.]|nr:MAG: hypothetical protein DCF22_08895 [Leptolyngbya sp.]